MIQGSRVRTAVMLNWHHQLKNTLLIQDRLMSIDDQAAGIDEELHFWQGRLTNLHGIESQLQREPLQTIVQVLVMSKSAYIQQFLQAHKEIQVGRLSSDRRQCRSFMHVPGIHRLRRRLLAISEYSRRTLPPAEHCHIGAREKNHHGCLLSNSNHLASFEILRHARQNEIADQQGKFNVRANSRVAWYASIVADQQSDRSTMHTHD